jgi:hypothetical protein
MNPTSFARQQKAEEMEKLRKENDSLRLKIQALEGKSPPGSTISDKKQITPEMGPSAAKQVEGIIFIQGEEGGVQSFDMRFFKYDLETENKKPKNVIMLNQSSNIC